MGEVLDQTYFVQPQRRANKQDIPPRDPTHYAVYREGVAGPVFTFSVYRWGREVALRLANQYCADLNAGVCSHEKG
jgi:hypothetical protein